MKRLAVAAAITAAMLMMTATLFAAEQSTPKSEPIYGYRMMSDQERNEYRERMRDARSGQERQAIRDEHRKLMEARAKERGVTLPEQRGPRAGGPGPRGGGPGAAMGPGAGMGPGGGMGPRAGMGPGTGPGYGPGPRAECPAGQDCPGPGAGGRARQQ